MCLEYHADCYQSPANKNWRSDLLYSGCRVLGVSVVFDQKTAFEVFMWLLNMDNFSMAEITSGIFCGCLIVFPRFYRSTVSPYTTAIFSVFRSRFSHYQIYDSGSNSSKRKSPRNWYHQPLQRDLAETNELRGLKPTYIPEYICEVSTEYNLHPREPSVPITGNELSSSIEQVSTS